MQSCVTSASQALAFFFLLGGKPTIFLSSIQLQFFGCLFAMPSSTELSTEA